MHNCSSNVHLLHILNLSMNYDGIDARFGLENSEGQTRNVRNTCYVTYVTNSDSHYNLDTCWNPFFSCVEKSLDIHFVWEKIEHNKILHTSQTFNN